MSLESEQLGAFEDWAIEKYGDKVDKMSIREHEEIKREYLDEFNFDPY